jgi:stage III sporulation protein SpoIIIAA
LKLLPAEINQAVKDAARGSINTVIEIVVDLGRVPIIRFSDSPDVLLDGEEIMDMEPFVTTILANSQRADFSQDNRIGIEVSPSYSKANIKYLTVLYQGSLHRIAAIKSTDNRVTGLTYRIGRHFPHSAEIFTDLIARVAPQKVSVLLVGEPGTHHTPFFTASYLLSLDSRSWKNNSSTRVCPSFGRRVSTTCHDC